MVISQKLGRYCGLDFRERDDGFFLSSTGPGALAIHQSFKSGVVHSESAFTSHEFR